MKKRIISLALSALTAISAVSAMSSNARDYWGSGDEETLLKQFEDCVNLEDYEWICKDNDTIAVYMRYWDSHAVLYYLTPLNNIIEFTITDKSFFSELEAAISEIDENLKLYCPNQPTKGLYNCIIHSSEIGVDTVKKIREAIGEKTENFEYIYNQIYYSSGHYNHMTGYPIFGPDENNNNIMYEDILKKYIESNNIDAEVVVYSSGDTDSRGELMSQSMIHIIPNKELTPLEHFQFAKEVYEATGIRPTGVSPESVNPSLGSTLDLTNYLNGDANCDNVQSMADAASIFQAIGNPDKYSLSDLGIFNADYANDGLTPDDALAIQKKLAGIAE